MPSVSVPPVIVPEPVMLVAPVKAPLVSVAVPSVKEPPVTVPAVEILPAASVFEAVVYVKSASSTNAPDVPANVTRVAVKSDTIADANVASPDVPNVVTPDKAPLVSVAVPSVSVPTVAVPVTSSVVDAVIAPVTANVEPLNAKFELSSRAPEVPASTTLPDVKSDTVAEASVLSPVTPSVVEIVAAPVTANVLPSHPKSELVVNSPLLENIIAASSKSETTSSLPVGTVTLPVPLAARFKAPLVLFDVIVLPSRSMLSAVTLPNTAAPSVPETTSPVIDASE